MITNSPPAAAKHRGRLGSAVRATVRRRPIFTFLVLAFLGMWAALCVTFLTGAPLRLTSAVGAYLGLALPAVLVTGARGGRRTVMSLLRRSVVPSWRPLPHAVAALAVPVTTIALALLTRPRPDLLATLEPVQLVAGFAIELLIALATIQIAEEIGWTGVAQHILQERHRPIVGAILIAPAFAAIHLPTYVLGTGLTPAGVATACLQLLPVTAFAVAFRTVIAWSYNAAGASILAAATMHASFNTASGSAFLGALGPSPLNPMLPLIAVVLIAAGAAVVTRGRLGAPPAAH